MPWPPGAWWASYLGPGKFLPRPPEFTPHPNPSPTRGEGAGLKPSPLVGEGVGGGVDRVETFRVPYEGAGFDRDPRRSWPERSTRRVVSCRGRRVRAAK